MKKPFNSFTFQNIHTCWLGFHIPYENVNYVLSRLKCFFLCSALDFYYYLNSHTNTHLCFWEKNNIINNTNNNNTITIHRLNFNPAHPKLISCNPKPSKRKTTRTARTTGVFVCILFSIRALCFLLPSTNAIIFYLTIGFENFKLKIGIITGK